MEQTPKTQQVLDAIADYIQTRGGASNTNTFNINAGGLGIAVCVFACLLAVYVSIDAKLQISDMKGDFARQLQQERDERHHAADEAQVERVELRQSVNANKAYLSAIFQRAPELKDQIDKSKEQSK